jgi:hypothetical protein
METRKIAAILSLVGSIFIILNILLTSANGAPIFLQNGAQTIDDAMKDSAQFWFRIAFGFADYTTVTPLIMGLIMATIMLLCSLGLYFKPRNTKPLSTLIILFSAVALLYGGGFILGSVLAFIGGGLNYEAPKPFEGTLIGKMLSALAARSKLFDRFMNETSVRDAALTVLFVNILSGIGNGIYTSNVTQVLGAKFAELPFEVLFAGRVNLDQAILPTPVILMGFGIIKWALLSLILFFVGVRLFGEKASIVSIAACTGFAYTPISLQLFTSFAFTSKPYLATWSTIVFLATGIWMAIILMAGMKHILSTSYTKAAATVASCGAIYTLINYFVLTQVTVPYTIQFQIQPPQTMLTIISLFIALPILFMGRKHN